jgi:hypothetical protein
VPVEVVDRAKGTSGDGVELVDGEAAEENVGVPLGVVGARCVRLVVAVRLRAGACIRDRDSNIREALGDILCDADTDKLCDAVELCDAEALVLVDTLSLQSAEDDRLLENCIRVPVRDVVTDGDCVVVKLRE